MTHLDNANGLRGASQEFGSSTDGSDIQHQLVDATFSATINAAIDRIDIPSWCFNLPEHEYQACSPAHVAAGFTTSPDGKRMSINVEVIGATVMVQHYVEKLGRKDHLILESVTDVFTPAGRSTFLVSWDMSVRAVDGARCEFTNRVRSSPSEDFLALLARQGIPFDQFRAQRQQASTEHLKNETPLFAASIERSALKA
jgi:hypothetical protein